MPTSAPPTVLQILPSLTAGGVERGTLEISEALRAAGGRALVASSGGRLVPELLAMGVRHITLPLDSKNPLTIWRNADALAAIARAEQVTILHARSRAPAWSALRAARRIGARFVTTYHGSYAEGLPGKRWYNSVMARGDRVIAISDYIARLVQARHGVPHDRLRVIPRGVDLRIFDPGAVAPGRVSDLRGDWNLPPDRPIILLPARLTHWKGQQVLIKAMAQLPGDAIALLVGEGRGGQRDDLARQAAALKLGDRVRLVGHSDDMPAALLLADVVVHASTQPEAFGRTVIEAQAMGKPVIAANLGAPADVIRPGDTGWLVPPGDPAALARLLQAVLAMPAPARAAIAARGRAEVLAHYTTAAMQAATLAVYRELA